jgi:polyisoprenoid-binding protein YceI
MNAMRRLQHAFACAVVFASVTVASAQTYVFQLDPQQSQVAFTLGDVLHTVHGTFQLKSGTVRFDTSTADASGLLVVDATSGNSGSKPRDRKMHKEILESEKYPDITFAPQHLRGQVSQDGKSQVTMDGVLTLHGQPHQLSLTVPVEVHSGRASADLTFVVPYVQWGLKNPSTFILRVNDKVDINVHAVGRLEPSNP